MNGGVQAGERELTQSEWGQGHHGHAGLGAQGVDGADGAQPGRTGQVGIVVDYGLGGSRVEQETAHGAADPDGHKHTAVVVVMG